MEDLIKKAFSHVDLIGPKAQEGHYDLINSEGQIILPAAWAAIIKPGASVSMVMWPAREWTEAPQRASPSMRRPVTWKAAYSASPVTDGMPTNEGASAMPGPAYNPPTAPTPSGNPASLEQQRRNMMQGRAQQQTLPSRHCTWPLHRDRPSSMPPTRHPQFYHAPWLQQSAPMPQKSDSEDSEDIDKELGLDELETAVQIASKDIDELLAAWTNPASGEGNDGAPLPSS